MASKKIIDLDTNASPKLTDYTILDDGIDTKKVSLDSLKTLIGGSTATGVGDGLTTFGGNKYLLQKTWKNSTTPVGSLINLSNDGVAGVNSGGIIYHQNNGTNRRCYLVNEGRTGGKCLRFQLTPVGSKNPITGATESVNTQQQYWNSGFGLSPGSNTYDCVEGDELFVRVYLYFSSNYSFEPGAGSAPKYFRVYPFRWDSGEIILQVDGDGQNYQNTPGAMVAYAQNWANGNTNIYAGQYGGVVRYLPLGRWFSIENYLKISATPGIARWICWLDGLQAWDITNAQVAGYQNLNPSTTTTSLMNMPRIVLNSTFDGVSVSGATLPNGPQYSMYDSVVMTNSRTWVEANGTQDAFGNWCIGPNY